MADVPICSVSSDGRVRLTSAALSVEERRPEEWWSANQADSWNNPRLGKRKKTSSENKVGFKCSLPEDGTENETLRDESSGCFATVSSPWWNERGGITHSTKSPYMKRRHWLFCMRRHVCAGEKRVSSRIISASPEPIQLFLILLLQRMIMLSFCRRASFLITVKQRIVGGLFSCEVMKKSSYSVTKGRWFIFVFRRGLVTLYKLFYEILGGIQFIIK